MGTGRDFEESIGYRFRIRLLLAAPSRWFGSTIHTCKLHVIRCLLPFEWLVHGGRDIRMGVHRLTRAQFLPI